MIETMCYSCDKKIELIEENISRREECPHCEAALRCCKMCEFYDERSYNECREPAADRITEKEKANFCGFFKIGQGINRNQERENALSAAAALFKKK
jgi:hypothetical protein